MVEVAKPVWSPLTKPGRCVWVLAILGFLHNEEDMTLLFYPLGHEWWLQGNKAPLNILLPVTLVRIYLEMYTFMQIKSMTLASQTHAVIWEGQFCELCNCQGTTAWHCYTAHQDVQLSLLAAGRGSCLCYRLGKWARRWEELLSSLNPGRIISSFLIQEKVVFFFFIARFNFCCSL